MWNGAQCTQSYINIHSVQVYIYKVHFSCFISRHECIVYFHYSDEICVHRIYLYKSSIAAINRNHIHGLCVCVREEKKIEAKTVRISVVVELSKKFPKPFFFNSHMHAHIAIACKILFPLRQKNESVNFTLKFWQHKQHSFDKKYARTHIHTQTYTLAAIHSHKFIHNTTEYGSYT